MGGTRVEPSSSWVEGTNALWRVPQFRTNLAIPIKLMCMFLECGRKLEWKETLHVHKENNMTKPQPEIKPRTTAEYFMFKPSLPLLHILIKIGRTKLSNQYCSFVFVSLYTLCVYIMVGSLGLPALIHRAGTSQHCACFTPPRSPPVLDLHDLRERDGGLLLFSELYFSSATKTLQ